VNAFFRFHDRDKDHTIDMNEFFAEEAKFVLMDRYRRRAHANQGSVLKLEKELQVMRSVCGDSGWPRRVLTWIASHWYSIRTPLSTPGSYSGCLGAEGTVLIRSQEYDTNGDGMISPTELRAILKVILECALPAELVAALATAGGNSR
jgi:hypothetical protein